MSRNIKNKPKNTQKRLVNNIPMPTSLILDIKDLFDDENKVNKTNLIKLKKHFENEGRISNDLTLKLIEMTSDIMRPEPNVLKLDAPINIIGDIHGQFYDLLTIFTLGGNLEYFKYLFMGDFVDRGLFSFECVCYLYCLKIAYPDRIYLIRGNHESRHLTKFFTFRDECLLKSNEQIYDSFMKSFDHLPISAVVDSKFFCVHGGLSPSFTLINELDKEDRFKEIPKHGLVCDLTWSDPIENFDENINLKNIDEDTYDHFLYNPSRGCSFNFDHLAVKKFLSENNLISVIRAHQVQREGIYLSPCLLNKDKTSSFGFPSLISIFSAPNYCDVYQNKAAIIQYTREKFTIKLFNSSDHPFVLPNFQNAFTWSLPFIFEKINDLFLFFLNLISDEELTNLNDDFFIDNDKKPDYIKNIFKKINLVKTDRDALKNVNQLSKSDLKLGALTPNERLRRRSSDADRELLNNLEIKGVESFEDANKLDNLQYKIINYDDDDNNKEE